MCNGRQHAALGGAVQLGNDQAGQPQCVVERAYLGQRVLAGVAIDHQQHLVRRRGIGLGDHAADFFQLVHQVQLRRQAPSGVDQHHVLAARLAGGDGVKAHGGRIAPFLADDFDQVAVGPDTQLLACCRAESVCGCQQHQRAFVGQVFGQLANRRGLARAVDADHHDHRGLVQANDQRPFQRLQQVCQRICQQLLDGGRFGGLAVLDAALEVGQQPLRRLDAGVSHQQRFFQLLIQRIVNACAGKHRGDARPCLAQPVLEAVHPAAACGFRWYG